VQRGVGVDEGAQRLVSFAVALGLPRADRAALLKTGDDAFGGQLAEIVRVEAAGEVDGPGAGFGQFQIGLDGIFHRVDADDEERDLALVGAGRAARPDRDARTATTLDRPNTASEADTVEVVGCFAVVAVEAVLSTASRRRAIQDGGTSSAPPHLRPSVLARQRDARIARSSALECAPAACLSWAVLDQTRRP